MAKVFVNYTGEQLIMLSIVMAQVLRQEYDEDDQVIVIELLGLIADNMGMIIAQKAYLDGALQRDLGEYTDD